MVAISGEAARDGSPAALCQAAVLVGGERREVVGSHEWETEERIAATDFKSEYVVLLAMRRRSGSEGWVAWTRRSSAGAGELSLCRWGHENCGPRQQ